MGFSFHLCQPGQGASCGACCGLYNFRDHSRESLRKTLSRRSAHLRQVPKDAGSYRAAARSLRRWDKGFLFDAVKVCPLLGFVDEEEERVGCLAHPAVTGGVDLRDCGAYDSRTCSSFECPSFLWLDEPLARLVRAACPDWYLYGLVVTDVELVKGTMRLLERELGERVDPERILASAESLGAISRIFSHKEVLASAGRGGVFGRFHRDGLGEPTSRTIEYEALGAASCPEDDVVLCLGFLPSSREALEEAREFVRTSIRSAVRALAP